jgi:Ca2+-binding EF-hand superfamily protein
MGKAAGILIAGLVAAGGAAGALAAVGDPDGKPGANAQTQQQRGPAGLKRFDANGDQAVTVEEFLKRRVDGFTKRDKNGDGTLDGAELGQAPLGFRQQRQERRVERLLVRLDANSDGKLTKQEFDAEPVRADGRGAARAAERRQLMFQFFDRNGDGAVDKAEFDAGRAEEAEFRKRRRMHALDRDGDGKVTLEEFTADARFRFLRLDLDRDGRITAADLPPVERQRWSQR